MPTAPRPPQGNRFVFPYRVVLQHGDGSRETLDPEFPPVPLDIGSSVTFTDDTIIVADSSHETPGSWIVERIELASEDAITESYFERNPAFRNATVYCRPAKSK